MDINFETTEEVSSINVVMLSKGLIVHTLRLPMIDFRASTQIMPKFSFAPETTIFAYYVRSNGEIVSGSATLTLKSRLPNYVRKLMIFVFLKVCAMRLTIFKNTQLYS